MAGLNDKHVGTGVAVGRDMGAAFPIVEWLKLDRAICADVRVSAAESSKQLPIASFACTAIEIALVQKGTVRHRIAGREIVVPEGHVLVIPRDAERTTSFTTPHYAVALWLGDEMILELVEALEDEPANRMLAPGICMVRSRKIEPLLAALADEVASAPLGTTFAAEGICESVAIEMLRRSRVAGASTSMRDPRVRAAITQMQDSVSEDLAIDDLARNANMTRFDFSRLFRDEIGEAPYLFFLRLRVAHAVELLREGVSVTETAVASGFSDFGRFASAFKMHLGIEPHELRARTRVKSA